MLNRLGACVAQRTETQTTALPSSFKRGSRVNNSLNNYH